MPGPTEASKPKDAAKPAQKGKKDDKKPDELSPEDQQLKDELDLYVQRLKEPQTELYHAALEGLRNHIRTSTSSMTSVPKPLKFLRSRYEELVAVYQSWQDSDDKRFLADILSVLGMTSGKPGKRDTLSYRLAGTAEALASWGHEYVRYLTSEIIQENSSRAETAGSEPYDKSDLLKLARDVVPFCMQHNAEADACDLLMELESIDLIVEYVDAKNFERVCLYLSSCVNYVPEPEDRNILLTILSVYRKLNKYPEALYTALRLNDLDLINEVFESCSDEVEQKQLAFILARQRTPYKTEDSDLNDIINNSHLSSFFISLARDLEVSEPKSPDEIYKIHLEPTRPGQSSAQPDSAKHNLASSFVNAFVNAGFGKDKLISDGTNQHSWIYKNRDAGMTVAAASVGMIHMWDVDVGLTELDKLLYVKEDQIKAGALLGFGIVNTNVRNEYDPALALLTDSIGSSNVMIRNASVLGLGLAYAGTNRQEVIDQLSAIVVDSSLSMEVTAVAGLALGLCCVASANGDVTATFLQALLDREVSHLQDPFARFMALGLALVYLGKQEGAETVLEALKAIPEPMSKQAIVLLEICAYAGTGNVLKVQKMLHYCTDHLDSEKENDLFQAFAVIGIALIAMGEDIGAEMALRSFNHLMYHGEPVIRRAVPLALGLLCVSNPQDINLIDTISKYTHDNDSEVAKTAIFAMGMIGCGTNNARLAQMLRHLAAYYQKDANTLFMVRIAQGLLHMGKGTMTISPYHSGRLLMSPVAVAGLLSTLISLTTMQTTLQGRYPHFLYLLTPAMQPRMLITLDENLKPLPVAVRVGQAVDVVGQAGRPKTITGFQTHTTPVLIAHGERAELATDEYIPLSRTLEGFVLLKKNPNYKPVEIDVKKR